MLIGHQGEKNHAFCRKIDKWCAHMSAKPEPKMQPAYVFSHLWILENKVHES